jgi:hypothetical protein
MTPTDELKIGKYLTVRLLSPKTGAVTSTWELLSSGGDMLGIIKWYSAWRQYVLFPQPETVFNSECLKDITAFLVARMRERNYKP